METHRTRNISILGDFVPKGKRRLRIKNNSRKGREKKNLGGERHGEGQG